MIFKETNNVIDINSNTIFIDSLKKTIQREGHLTVDAEECIISVELSDIPNSDKLTPWLTKGIMIHDNEKNIEYYFKYTHKDMDGGEEDTYGWNYKSIDKIKGNYWKLLLIND